MMSELAWMYPAPYIMTWSVQPEEIDHYQHVNNVEYMRQLETVSWQHTYALGLTLEDFQALDRGMAIHRHEIDYLAAAKLGDELVCATWVVKCDHKLSLSRQFQIIRKSDQQTLLKALTHYVCIALSSGRPKRMPEIFAKTYGDVCLDAALTDKTV